MPLSRPEIVTTTAGPQIFHSDFSLVTSTRPARTGEVLIAKVTGLAPTRPTIETGRAFPSDVLHQVNSPITVSMNGQQAEVINAIGWPGLVDTYRVDLRVPSGVGQGASTLELSAAWITATPVRVPVE